MIVVKILHLARPHLRTRVPAVEESECTHW